MLKFCKFFFQLYVKVQRSIEETAAGTTGTIFVKCAMSGSDHALITCQTCVGIATKHKNFAAIHIHFRTLFACNLTKIGVNTGIHEFLGLTIILVSFC